ncbi:MAG: hypothetical protein CVU91_03765 [Firmicutes bacterium HGW-Firmicutes-16]|nr:MAG: hypothetical protein CVU91_03765 [Firmicutes bacterium HGW-Firmicutes-16]
MLTSTLKTDKIYQSYCNNRYEKVSVKQPCKERENGESSSQALFAATFERPVRAGGLSPI